MKFHLQPMPCIESRNVAGLMPHPERACEDILGSTDGWLIFKSMILTLKSQVADAVA